MDSSLIISKIDEFVIQEAIFPSDIIYKSYSIFGKHYIRLNNQIDLTDDKNDYVKANFKKEIDRGITSMEEGVGLLMHEELKNLGFINFGFDFVEKSGTKEFYFFDINLDNFSWQKNIKTGASPIMRRGLEALANKK